MIDDRSAGRRLADRISRWIEVVLLAAISALLSVIVYYYGGLPKQLNDLVTLSSNMQLELGYLKEEVRELKDAQRVSQGWRERLVDLESRVQRNQDKNAEQDARIERLEQPFGMFRSAPKKQQK